MQRNFLSLSKSIIAFFLFFSWGCTKIDTTTLGSDLIPAVDNIHTFADTLLINGTQGIFDDTTRLARTDYHVVGTISNDPIFGKTKSDLYLELKPSFFPFYFGNTGDTIDNVLSPATGANGTSFDSAVLCLSYKSFYGDTVIPQSLSVYQIDNETSNFEDSSYRINQFLPNGGLGNEIGRVTIAPKDLRNYTFFYPGNKKDSVVNQIRIKLDNSFLQSIIGSVNRDTSSLNSLYRTDSVFKSRMKGFAVKAQEGQGNGLFYVDLTDPKTRLEVHYKKIKNNKLDTAFSSFYFASTATSSISVSAHAINLQRDRTNAEISEGQAGALYIQTTPGTYATLSIPALATFQNSIIHRAEIFIEQIPSNDPVGKDLTPPLNLYLELVDTTTSGNQFKPIYYDLNPTTNYYPDNKLYPNFLPIASGIDFNYFGGFLRSRNNSTGGFSYYYNFNISRYVQHLVTNHQYNYTFRLSAPVRLSYYGYSIAFRNNLAYGRIKIGNGNNTTPGYRMGMRIVYTKL